MASQNPSPSADPPVSDETLARLGQVVAEALAANKAFITNVVSFAVEASVKSVAESVQRQRSELEAYAASLTQGSPAAPPGGTVATAIEKHTPKTNDEWRDALLMAAYNFLQNPVDNITKVVDVVQKFRRPALDLAGLKGITLEQIKLLAEAKPQEFAFVAQQVMPDPMNELIPQLTADAFRRGFGSLQEATRWARELVKQDYQAARRSTDGSSSSIHTLSSPSATEPQAHDGAVKPEPRPAVLPVVTAQNPKPSDWKLRL